MTKKVLAGFLVGGAAAFGAWQSLSADKKKQIKQAVADKTHDAVDYATDYAINALDLADGMVQDVKEQAVDKFGEAFEQTGAVKGADNVHINLEPDQDDITKLDAFAKQLVEKAAQD